MKKLYRVEFNDAEVFVEAVNFFQAICCARIHLQSLDGFDHKDDEPLSVVTVHDRGVVRVEDFAGGH
jgi:hypothetical protein